MSDRLRLLHDAQSEYEDYLAQRAQEFADVVLAEIAKLQEKLHVTTNVPRGYVAVHGSNGTLSLARIDDE